MKHSSHILADLKEASAKQLENTGFIEFAILFGSCAEGRATDLSDVDIGIFTSKDISLLEIGFLAANLESALRLNVDVVILNHLYKKKPALAYEIVSMGKILFCKNETAFIDFKKNTLIYYMESKTLLDEVNRTFINRLNNGGFGEHRHGREAKTTRE